MSGTKPRCAVGVAEVGESGSRGAHTNALRAGERELFRNQGSYFCFSYFVTCPDASSVTRT